MISLVNACEMYRRASIRYYLKCVVLEDDARKPVFGLSNSCWWTHLLKEFQIDTYTQTSDLCVLLCWRIPRDKVSFDKCACIAFFVIFGTKYSLQFALTIGCSWRCIPLWNLMKNSNAKEELYHNAVHRR